MKAWEVKLVKPRTDVPDPLGYTKNLSDVSYCNRLALTKLGERRRSTSSSSSGYYGKKDQRIRHVTSRPNLDGIADALYEWRWPQHLHDILHVPGHCAAS